MTILLKDIWPIGKTDDYKVHFARWNGDSQPLEVFVRDKGDWQGWQEYRPSRDDFNRPFIFSLAQFYHETDAWLFGGVFKVLARHKDRYEVELTGAGNGLIGRTCRIELKESPVGEDKTMYIPIAIGERADDFTFVIAAER